MASVSQRMLLAYRTVGKRFGAWFGPVLTVGLFAVLRITVWLGQQIDILFFPLLKKQEIIEPIVIVGNPRTGTTFLQRFLDENGVGVGQQVWQQLYPSLILQSVLRPFLPILERVSPAKHHSTVAHHTSLTSVETDDASVFFRYFDGFFLYGFLLAHADQDVLDWFDSRKRDNSQRDYAWLRQLWKRNLISRNHHRVVAKLFSVGADLKSFQQEFPDAKILYMARDPVQVVPSGISLITGVLEKRFQFSAIPEEYRRRYCHRMRDAFIELQQRFVADWNNGALNKENIKIVPYSRLMSDFDGLMKEISTFIDHPIDDQFQQVIAAQAEKQRSYQSKHQYNLSQFYLEEEQLREQASFFYSFLAEVE